ncbi:MAG: ABC transporter ATP-binding protein, partial [Endozoicomonas sp. (ex Botrylloides leachii)]|nr:ABC transporter ATP-binding protein [Endozoicomonas sp. (ex Botrylloides leachii)]
MSVITKPIIQLESVQFSWKQGLPVLLIDELSVKAHEKLFIYGSSGSGKTTLLGLIGGVLVPDSGSVSILGQSFNTLSLSQRDHFRANHIGFIFQLFNLIPYLSIIENITLPLQLSDNRRHRLTEQSVNGISEAERLVKQLGLYDPSLLKSPVTELSIGQQQRVAAARALIGQPEIIIADEPTSALDEATRNDFIQLLFTECQSANSTLIFVSHDISLKPLFDRSISLDKINVK